VKAGDRCDPLAAERQHEESDGRARRSSGSPR
jgi:hypothetical protein